MCQGASALCQGASALGQGASALRQGASAQGQGVLSPAFVEPAAVLRQAQRPGARGAGANTRCQSLFSILCSLFSLIRKKTAEDAKNAKIRRRDAASSSFAFSAFSAVIKSSFLGGDRQSMLRHEIGACGSAGSPSACRRSRTDRTHRQAGRFDTLSDRVGRTEHGARAEPKRGP
jgi:hypothetical protein